MVLLKDKVLHRGVFFMLYNIENNHINRNIFKIISNLTRNISLQESLFIKKDKSIFVAALKFML